MHVFIAGKWISTITSFLLLTTTTASPLPHEGHSPSVTATASAAPESSSDVAQAHQNFGDYIFRFKTSKNVDTKALLADLEPHGFNNSHLYHTYSHVFNGFSAAMSDHCVGILKTMVSEENVIIEEVKEFKLQAPIKPRNPDPAPDQPEVQLQATWGLQRMSQPDKVDFEHPSEVATRKFQFNYEDSAAEGVDIYILDTGVNEKHLDFGGRAKLGYVGDLVLQEEGREDQNGHGTHCAGTAGSATFGVAKKSNIIAVKVMNRDSSGKTPDIIAGIEWMIQRHKTRSSETNFKGSVASMSFSLDIPDNETNGNSTSRSQLLDDAIKNANAAGIHTIIAAGNQGLDACRMSPGALSREVDEELNYNAGIITVGASDVDDNRADFSNHGGCITTYAPGDLILSTWIGSNTAVQTMKGTSMATPYVAGLVGYFLGLKPELKVDVLGMKKHIMNMAIGGVLGNLLDEEDTGLLAFNGFSQS